MGKGKQLRAGAMKLVNLLVYSGCIIANKSSDTKHHAQGEDRTHDLQITLSLDYETDALPTALPRHIVLTGENELLYYITVATALQRYSAIT